MLRKSKEFYLSKLIYWCLFKLLHLNLLLNFSLLSFKNMTSSLLRTENDANQSLSPESVSSYSNNLSNSLENEVIKSGNKTMAPVFPSWNYHDMNSMTYMQPAKSYNDENEMGNNEFYRNISLMHKYDHYSKATVNEANQIKTPLIDYYNCKSECN